MGKILGQRFFKRETIKVAEELLGSYLVRKQGRWVEKFLINEVEVYDGLKDKASHASRGETGRNGVMFGEAGRFYVYFIYGIHWMLNIVTRETGYPAAILIRGIEGHDGPAKLTKALRIDKKFNGVRASEASGLWFERGTKMPNGKIVRLPRVGVAYAGPAWSRRKLRFRIDSSPIFR